MAEKLPDSLYYQPLKIKDEQSLCIRRDFDGEILEVTDINNPELIHYIQPEVKIQPQKGQSRPKRDERVTDLLLIGLRTSKESNLLEIKSIPSVPKGPRPIPMNRVRTLTKFSTIEDRFSIGLRECAIEDQQSQRDEIKCFKTSKYDVHLSLDFHINGLLAEVRKVGGNGKEITLFHWNKQNIDIMNVS